MNRHHIALALLFAVLSFPTFADTEPSRVMIVLDASGSMWGQLDGKTKIEIAREVIEDLLDDIDQEIEIGLVAYGHRREGDCNDIETLVPVRSGSGDAITRAVQALNPKGKTPLSEAVRRSAIELGYADERATVVLISDGVETCDADPCAIGAELAMGGVDFTAHVIGFAVKEAEQAGLKCLAENTDGLFLEADDAGALRSALDETVERVKEAPRPIVENPGEATVDAPEEIGAGKDFEVEWTGPDSRSDYVTIVRKDRHSEDWYLGSITDENGRCLEANLSFLEPNRQYVAEIYRDGDDADWETNPYAMTIEKKLVTSLVKILLRLAPGGGTAIRFRPAKAADLQQPPR